MAGPQVAGAAGLQNYSPGFFSILYNQVSGSAEMHGCHSNEYSTIILFSQCAIQKYVVAKDFINAWGVYDFLKLSTSFFN